MKYVFALIIAALLIAGCSNTYRGVKQDTQEATQWTKGKVNKGAKWVDEKTE